ncbi:hypothetical protein CEUSTIGMA_g5446.t1 [Chlamydomonas eustigma]|uniref:N(6)-L-threonylcarbamoyladenine synthase n=1 Tax=Chlamydomonas eustigma TaxID=1157962 RepID=A0A250X4J9_9CHLO|nr:hypothetical protein CEUSTIGMA_g5446.t1 [Chlamydomonas eustigma]|eukprot:GAX78004.1 hypothetical protein CEUSTIGMA_g5446.t1 [Chlamydomonas eustigma]
MEAHERAIDRVVDEALTQAGITVSEVDVVAVTIGPGLSLCLRVGVSKARQISRDFQIPIINVHHMEGHALVARLPAASAFCPTSAPELSTIQGALLTPTGNTGGAQQSKGVNDSERSLHYLSKTSSSVQFPFLCLLVSGGHNLLLLVKGVGQYVQLGTTLDDALGEAYDKVARLLGLDLKPNGGAALESFAKQGDPLAFKFVLPMKKYQNCDFSFAGLKTSVRLCIEATVKEHQVALASAWQHRQDDDEMDSSEMVYPSSPLSPEAINVSPSSSSQDNQCEEDRPSTSHLAAEEKLKRAKADIAASFQRTACLHLMDRVKRAISWAREMEPNIETLVVAGGVASNQYIRSELSGLCQSQGMSLVLPPPKWCVDNGVMVAWVGVERMRLGLMEPPPSKGGIVVTAVTDVAAPEVAGRQDHEEPPAALKSAGDDEESCLKVEQQPSKGAYSSPSQAEINVSKATLGAAVCNQMADPILECLETKDVGAINSTEMSPSHQPEPEWVELRPRWPLTNDKHPSCMPADKLRSAKKARMHASLTEMTAASLEALAVGAIQ